MKVDQTLFAREGVVLDLINVPLNIYWLEIFSCAKIRMVSQDNLLNYIWHLSKLTFSAKSFILSRKLHSNVARGEHYGLAICIKKYLKAKEELWKLKYFTMQKYSVQKTL